ncbi:MAG: helix-turn-helix domain-containing protein [Bacteroidota bacterium]
MIEKDVRMIARTHCPMMKTAALLGERWTLMLIRECFLGFRRFDEFKENLQISKSVLSTKLRYLVEEGILEKSTYREGKQRERYEYLLTKKGKDLYKILIALTEWGNAYLTEDGVETVDFFDEESKQPTTLNVVDINGNIVPKRNMKIGVNINRSRVGAAEKHPNKEQY